MTTPKAVQPTPESFDNPDEHIPAAMAEQLPPEALEQMKDMKVRFSTIADLLDGDRVHLPFTVVHAHRVD